MRTSGVQFWWTWLLITLFRVTLAQYTDFSACLKQCVTSSVPSSCNGDPECICLSISFDDLVDCTCRVCDSNDVSMLRSTVLDVCSRIPNSGVLTCPDGTRGARNITSSITTSSATSSATLLDGTSTAKQDAVITPSGSTTAPAAAATSPSSGLSTGAKAGIGAGAGGVVVVVIGLVVFFVLRRKVQVSWRSLNDSHNGDSMPLRDNGTSSIDHPTIPTEKKAVTPVATTTELSSQEKPYPTSAISPITQSGISELVSPITPVTPYAEAPTIQGNRHELGRGNDAGRAVGSGPLYSEAPTQQGNSHELGGHAETGPRYAEVSTTQGNSHELGATTISTHPRAVHQQQYNQGGYAELSADNYTR